MLIIFDCDGVLVDSERLHAQVFSEQLSKIGIQKTVDSCFTDFKGLVLQDCFDLIERTSQTRLPNTFLQSIHLATIQAFEMHLQPIPGVCDLLALLHMHGVSMCVASNGDSDKLKRSLKMTGLDQYFAGRFFSSDQVRHGKPKPDLFLYAAKSCGFKAEKAWVIEDSDTGVSAALAAGMRTFRFDPYGISPAQEGVIQFSEVSWLGEQILTKIKKH